MRPTTLWCFADHKNWGLRLGRAAAKRGWNASLFSNVDQVNGGLAFVHMHHEHHRRDHDKKLMIDLNSKGVKLIPGIVAAYQYDDKVAQTSAFRKWMPQTHYLPTKAAAMRVLNYETQYPFISKATQGSSSYNVRLIRNEREALHEIEAVFGGMGLPLHHKQRQRGYLLWQEFVAGNDYDVRVIAIGKQRMALKRFIRSPDKPFASGSGKLEPITNPSDPVIVGALTFADRFFEQERQTWCGIDLVFDHKALQWRLLETTVGWTMPGYAGCTFFPDGRNGAAVWDVTLDEIERGNLG